MSWFLPRTVNGGIAHQGRSRAATRNPAAPSPPWPHRAFWPSPRRARRSTPRRSRPTCAPSARSPYVFVIDVDKFGDVGHARLLPVPFMTHGRCALPAAGPPAAPAPAGRRRAALSCRGRTAPPASARSPYRRRPSRNTVTSGFAACALIRLAEKSTVPSGDSAPPTRDPPSRAQALIMPASSVSPKA